MEAIGYDPVYNLLGFSLKDGLSQEETQFEYDSFNQLTQETGERSHSYQFDSLYNRTQKDDTPYELNGINQLTHQADTNYSYDPNGNLTDIRSSTKLLHLEYDTLDRLISVEDNGSRFLYAYDGFNRRTSKTTQQKVNSQWQTTDHLDFLYDGMDEIGAYQDSSLKELSILGQNTTIALEKGNTLYSPLKNPFGHISLLLNAHTGAPEQYFRYTAYGECTLFDARKNTLALSATLTPWMLSSKRYDQETGFTLYGLRYYAPNIGRWITPDPAGFQDGPNLYTYVHNNPLAFTDLYGLGTVSSGLWGFFCAAGTEVAIWAGIAGVTLINPAAGACLAYARTAYNIGSLGYTGYQIVDLLLFSGHKEHRQ